MAKKKKKNHYNKKTVKKKSKTQKQKRKTQKNNKPITKNFNNNSKKIEQKKIQKKKKNSIYYIVLALSFIIIIIAVISIFKKSLDLSNSKNKIDKINKVINDTTPTNNINNNDVKNSNKYSDIDFNNVDFEKLKKINNEVNSILSVDGTKIKYPVVKHNDNSYYLNHSFDNSNNSLGWIFMDYRNDINNLSTNTIIYGHAVLDSKKLMFGSLYNTLNNSWFKNSNHKIYLKTESKLYEFNIFSVYIIDDENYYLTSSFTSDISYDNYLKDMKERSKYNFNQEVTTNNNIITLSTCYSGNKKRLVVQGVLIN